MRADDWAVAQEEDEAIWRPVFSEWLKSGNKPRTLALERIGCRTAEMPYGEMVSDPQRSMLKLKLDAARG